MKVFFLSLTICTFLNVSSQENNRRNAYELKNRRLFRYSGFIIDTVRTVGNSVAKPVNGSYDNNEYYPIVLPDTADILKVENSLNNKISLNGKYGRRNISKMMYNRFRQYFAYKKNEDTLILNILFCSKKLVKSYSRIDEEIFPLTIYTSYANKGFFYYLELNLDKNYNIRCVERFYKI